MIQIVSKNTGLLMNYKELICFQLTTQKRDIVWMEKDLEESLRQ